ncbi:GNAT family N-acetyltransferase [Sphingomonas crusticola]|uniref:GNAT family N-acetyltransferase n=1 Tax=Sphingomonas crusticola TaxID=1697973 RepID=UPI000E230284|nr:GNAT family N-acetyltransferase [Sphingomonas crusticola]
MAADPDLIALWIKGWAITRDVAPPVPYKSGHYLEVGLADQRARYLFATLDTAGIAALGRTINEPWIYLKVCAPEADVRALLPAQWQIRTPPTYMMAAELRPTRCPLADEYRLSFVQEDGVLTASIHRAEDLAARGRLVTVEGAAIFDQIRTQEAHQRRGLGRALMAALANEALDRSAQTGVLAATEMGRGLYEAIGWRVHSPYTSAFIPGRSDQPDPPV